jgi:hypothetical protein
LNLSHRHPSFVERENLVVEAGEATLVLRNQAGFEAAFTIAWDVDRERPVVGQNGLAARPIAMIGGVFGLGAARRIAEMMRELTAQGALDNGFLEPADRGVELLRGDRTLAHELVEDLGGDRRQRRVRRQAFPFAAHRYSSCYAPHTKFLTPSFSIS